MPGLQIQTFDNRRLFRLLDEDELTIGRQIGSDITLAEAKVSRAHARIVKDGKEYILYDRKIQRPPYHQGMITRSSNLWRGPTRSCMYSMKSAGKCPA